MTTVPKGVYTAKKKDNSIYYRSSITFKRKHISLGSFSECKSAHKAYLEADRILHTAGLTVRDYTRKSALDFEKWVVLLNFKENGLYFSTPIFVRGKILYYYLSPEDFLIFDIDELFFYSSHKIMRRKGHLFVADYGMQVNILNRYGIRNYSVPGKDYIFLNGNDSDFRHENLKLINPYLGVTKFEKKGKTFYKTRINIPGYFVIGIYDSDIEAAIAYNKAIDILKRNGCKRNYSPNYIEDLSPSLYADIYAKCKISDKISNISF